jgi:signal transduction histidine kinase
MPGYIWKVDDLHCRLKAVVANTVAANPNRTIITNISFDQPVDCDPARIQELASNLLNNALAHGAPSGPVSFIASAQNNDLEIAVWNEGNVISTQALRHVFSPALRPGIDPPAARHALYTCAEIVRAHLGTIRVTSSPTEGTQFVARIPVARSQRLH